MGNQGDYAKVRNLGPRGAVLLQHLLPCTDGKYDTDRVITIFRQPVKLVDIMQDDSAEISNFGHDIESCGADAAPHTGNGCDNSCRCPQGSRSEEIQII